MNYRPVLLVVLLLSLVLTASAYALHVLRPEVDWQVGVVALVVIGLAGGGMILAGNARRRRETRAEKQAARASAARAQAAITGGEPNGDLHALAADLDLHPFRPRKPRHRRLRDGAGERDQNSPGTSLHRTRSQ